MKKFFLGMTAAIGLAAPAIAADMPVKAPLAPPPVYTWNGCYVGVGFGYGMWTQDNRESFLDGSPDSFNQTSGGRGWLGMGQVGCDYQVSGSWVIGAFADWDPSRIRGDHTLSMATFPFVGQETMTSSWAAGGRLGWLPMRGLMVYVSGGYTQARFSGYDLSLNFVGGGPPIFHVDPRTRSGYFIGAGYEYDIGWFRGLTWKTESRFADYGSVQDTVFTIGTGAPFRVTSSHKYLTTVTSALVWRFGGGPLVARY